MAVQVQPLGSGFSIPWIENITPADSYGLVRARFDDTNSPALLLSVSTPGEAPNTGEGTRFFQSAIAPTSVDRTIDFMMTHYADLLRRLAD